jgi:hypothetical protein
LLDHGRDVGKRGLLERRGQDSKARQCDAFAEHDARETFGRRVECENEFARGADTVRALQAVGVVGAGELRVGLREIQRPEGERLRRAVDRDGERRRSARPDVDRMHDRALGIDQRVDRGGARRENNVIPVVARRNAHR